MRDADRPSIQGTPVRVKPHPVEVAGNSPVYSHRLEMPHLVAEWVGGKPGCKSHGRKSYIRYSSTPALHRDKAGLPLQFHFEDVEKPCFDGVPHVHTTLNKGHMGIERRKCWTISNPACMEYLDTSGEWPGLRSVTKEVCRQETDRGARVHSRYYISSLDNSAQRLLMEVSAHCSIENSRQWSNDVTFRGDQSRVHKDHAPPRTWSHCVEYRTTC